MIPLYLQTEFEKLKDCSIVLSSYGSKANPLGMLGLVGPKRMKYSKALALVNTMKTTIDTYCDNKYVLNDAACTKQFVEV